EDRLADLSDNVLVLPSIGRRVFVQEDRHWAVFVEGQYALTEQLSVNGSLRYTDEERRLINFRAIGESDPFQILVDTPGDLFLGPRSVDYSLGDQLSGHIGLDYKLHENTLLYGKVVRGFKSGGFFGGFALSEDELDPYEEETVWAFEAGAKVDLPASGLRLNGAVFYYDYQDFQGFETVVDDIFGVVTGLGNLGDAEHFGADLEALWSPPSIEGLTLQAAATWLDTDIVESEFVETSALIDFVAGDPGDPIVISPTEGRPRGFAAEFSYVLGGQYERRINDTLTAAATLTWSWRSEFEDNSIFAFDGGLFAVDSYGLLTGSVSLASRSGWDVSVIGQNLTDEIYVTSATSDDLLSYGQIPVRPRSWQVQVRKAF
ncbi:MAG: TonB-dependent receptor, partial [Pseudomonadota bacterium]